MTPPKGRWGIYFRAARKKLGLSQVQMSAKLGTSQSWLSKIESGRITNPGVNEFLKLRGMLRRGALL